MTVPPELEANQFDFMGRGLFEHARFMIAPCMCEVVVQTLHAQMTGNKRSNSAIAATAIRVGQHTFAMTEGGTMSVTGGGFSSVLQPASVASSTPFGSTIVEREYVVGKRKKTGSVWAWRVILPGGAGNYLAYAVPHADMPRGFV